MKKYVDLSTFLSRYLRSKRKEKSSLLDELCDLYGYNRKYLLQYFNHLTGRKHIRRGAKQRYKKEELLGPLTQIWLATDQICSKRLKAAMPFWLPSYEKTYGALPEAIRKKLLTISPASIDRFLKPHKVHYKRHGLSGTKPGYLLKNQIPIKTDHWDVTQPGFMEADTVAHCGNTLVGDFIWSITLTDIMTAWTEIRATWNKGAEGVVHQIKDIEHHLPFELLGCDCDNGSEFLNYHLWHYLADRPRPVQFTRSRPYKKNDNAHVEQKNWTHVRHLFGYDRLDRAHLVPLMNDLYRNEWSLYQNHFMPSLKLISKEKINSKYRCRYEKPKTPYQRLLESSHISEEIKQQKMSLHKTLNPFELKIKIEEKVKVILSEIIINKTPRVKR